MTKEIRVPPLGESVSEATVARWLKKVGEAVRADETLVELETDKVALEVNAPTAGVLQEILVPEGSVVGVGKILGTLKEAANQETQNSEAQVFSASPQASPPVSPAAPVFVPKEAPLEGEPILSPAARKLAEEAHISPQDIPGTGPGGRVTKNDVQNFAAESPQESPSSSEKETSSPSPGYAVSSSRSLPIAHPEERVRMSRLRQRIAERLKEAQNTAAMLTTFNEIDMSHVMSARDTYRDPFEKRFGIKLGFMSFFVKAVVLALKEIPAVNAEIEDEYIIYKNYYDIGVAVAAPQGLVVPVVRDADHLSFAEIELRIAQLSDKARTGKLSMEDLQGGTFTITNGGVFGSLMSTPILNPPQSAILGMHKIEKRPVVVEDRIEIRPMMYVALTYDHRVIDGREAVTFLVRVKQNIEDPQRILLGI